MVPLLARAFRSRGRRLHARQPERRLCRLRLRREGAAALARHLRRVSLSKGGAMMAGNRSNAPRRFGRRAALSALGVSAAVAPFLPILEAEGQTAHPLRLIL